MGIFDTCFKPNVEKMKRKNDIEGLINALSHKDTSVRKEAIHALGMIRSFCENDIGYHAIMPPGPGVLGLGGSVMAESALERIDNLLLEPLNQSLQDKDEYIRERSAYILGEIRRRKTKK